MNALAISGVADAAVQVLSTAVEERSRMIDRLEAIEVVCDHRSNEKAVEIAREAAAMIKGVEKTRTFLNGPLLALQRELNSTAAQFCAPIEAAVRRVNEMLSEFAAQQRRIAEEAEAKKREELRRAEVERQKLLDVEAERQRAERRRIEQQRAEELKEAKTKADKEAVEARARREAEAAQARNRQEMLRVEADASARRIEVLSSVPAVVRAEGQVTRAVWIFDVVDIKALMTARPDLVTIEASKSAINAAIRLGMRECPGLVIRQEVKAGVRV